MIVPADNRYAQSTSPHSLGNRLSIVIPNPWFDTNPMMIEQKRFWGNGLQGLTFDGSGFLGTGLFSSDISEWGISEVVFGLIGIYGVYAMFFQAKQTKYRLEMTAGRRRKSRAAKLRAKAKRLEEQTTGIF